MNVYLVPARDASGDAKVVPDPMTGRPLDAGGENKPLDPYWRRRLIDGDVTQGSPPALSAPAASDASAASRNSRQAKG